MSQTSLLRSLRGATKESRHRHLNSLVKLLGALALLSRARAPFFKLSRSRGLSWELVHLGAWADVVLTSPLKIQGRQLRIRNELRHNLWSETYPQLFICLKTSPLFFFIIPSASASSAFQSSSKGLSRVLFLLAKGWPGSGLAIAICLASAILAWRPSDCLLLFPFGHPQCHLCQLL